MNKDYIYWCEHDDAKTGTRFTIELYKSTNNNGANPIDKSENNRIELPYNTLSVINIDYVLNDVRIGLSAPCYATIDVDFSVLENTEYLEDLQEAILFPQKKVIISETIAGTPSHTIIGSEYIGTNWRIHETTNGIKRLIFTGMHIVGLEGEFNFRNNKISVQVENIVSFAMKRIKFDDVMRSFQRLAAQNNSSSEHHYKTDLTTQVFYHYVDNDAASGGGRRALMFSPFNMSRNNEISRNNIATETGNISNRIDLGMAIIEMWNFTHILRHIGDFIDIAIYRITRQYEPTPPVLNADSLEYLFVHSLPIHRQVYDNSGKFGLKINDQLLVHKESHTYIIGKISGREQEAWLDSVNFGGRLYYDIRGYDGILRDDGRYENIFDFVNDLLPPFCVFAYFNNHRVVLSKLIPNSFWQLIINLDEDGVGYTLKFGISNLAKKDISNLEFYTEDVRDVQHSNSYSDAEGGLNIMTVFHNQPPNNSEGWAPLRADYPVVSMADFSGGIGFNRSFGYWGKSKPDGYVLDILKQGSRLGEKFALNLFYKRILEGTVVEDVVDDLTNWRPLLVIDVTVSAPDSDVIKRAVLLNGQWYYEDQKKRGYILIDGRHFRIEYSFVQEFSEEVYHIIYYPQIIQQRELTWQDNTFIAVHNGIEGLTVKYPRHSELSWTRTHTIADSGRKATVAENIMDIQAKGCFHNTIAKYIDECLLDSDKYAFCTINLSIPVKQLQNIYANTVGADYWADNISFIDRLLREQWKFILRTKNKIAGRSLSADDTWYLLSAVYNVHNGTFDLVLHNKTGEKNDTTK